MGGIKRGRSASPESKVTTRSQKRRAQGSSQSSQPSTSAEHVTGSLPLDSRFEGVLDRDTDRLHLGIDFGTSSCAAYYAIVPKDSINPLKMSPEKLDIHQGQSLLPAYVALLSVDNTNDAVLVFGNDVDAATKAGEISWDNVWSDLKQADFLTKLDELSAEKREVFTTLHAKHQRILKDARSYRKIFLNHEWMEKKQAVKLEKMEDVVDVLLRYFLMEIKSAIRDVSLLSEEAIDALLSGHRAEKFGDRVRVGVAIPEIWTSQRMMIYQCLRKAGFHEDLELLSEGRCALAKGLKNVLDDAARKNIDDQTKLLQELKQCVFLGIDDGGFTLVSG